MNIKIVNIPYENVCSISAQVCPLDQRRESAGLPWTIHTAGCPSSALTAAPLYLSDINLRLSCNLPHNLCWYPHIYAAHLRSYWSEAHWPQYTIYSIQPKLPIELYMFQCCLDNKEAMTNMMVCINVECLDQEHKPFCPTPAGLGRGGSWLIPMVSSASLS